MATKTRSHTKQEISSTIFDNPDMLRIVAENSQTPNIRAVNKNAALIGQSNMDKLGKKHGSFQEKLDFISNDELYANLPRSQPRNRKNEVVVRKNRAVNNNTFTIPFVKM